MLTPSLAAAWFTHDTTLPHSLHSYFTLKCLHSYLSRALFLHLIHWRLKLTTFIEKWSHLDTYNIYTLNISYLLVLLLPSFLYKNTTTPLSQNHFPVNLTTFMVESVIFFTMNMVVRHDLRLNRLFGSTDAKINIPEMNFGKWWTANCDFTQLQSTPDNSNLQEKQKKVQVIGSSSYRGWN